MALDVDSIMDCLGNPMKIRIMIMIKENGPMTPKEMLSKDRKLPQASLYRALKSMEEEEVIVTVAESKVRAVIEKRYSLNDELKGRIDEMVRRNDGDCYFKLFMNFAFSLMRRFQDYAQREDIDIGRDGSGFFAVPVYATEEELKALYTKLLETIAPYQKRASDAQAVHTLAMVLTPPETRKEDE